MVVSAPSSSPSRPTLVNKTYTTITISWTYPSNDADGYVVNTSSANGYVNKQKINASELQLTIKELLPGTVYSITVRAYQHILGPSSDVLLVTSKYMYILHVQHL